VFISRNYTYFGEGGQEDSTYRIGMADADFFMADADKVPYIGVYIRTARAPMWDPRKLTVLFM
jgi:hypothetical protein